jgi:hypothetical protein
MWVITAQLTVIATVVFCDNSTKEKILTVFSLKGKTRGEDIYHSFREYASDIDLPLQKLVLVTTDGPSAMVGRRNGANQSMWPSYTTVIFTKKPSVRKCSILNV